MALLNLVEMFAKDSLLRIYGFSLTVSLGLLVFVGVELGLAALLVAIMLVLLEVTFSFDNAIINAKILRGMTRAWQQAFMTVGILIAVFGVRVILPVLLVAIAANSSIGQVIDLALNNPDEYSRLLEGAHPLIVGFGGTFLLMLFLDFILQEQKVRWLRKIEELFIKVGRLESVSIIITLSTLLGIGQLIHGEEQETFLVAGMIGLLVYLIINSLDALLRKSGIESNLQKVSRQTFKAGLIGFIYLEIIDASFSLDGVIGAFAITKDIVLIAVGLGIGALFVRAMTIHMLRRKVMDKYRYLEHGAHYAIGALAVIMLASVKYHVPEIVVGLTGITIITITLLHSYKENKKDLQESR
jgi:hypothetical protein